MESSEEQTPPTVKSTAEPISWVAKEYISNEKNGLWYLIFAIVIIAIIAIDFLFLKSYSLSVLVVVMGIAIIVLSHRPAREIKYTLSGEQGLYVDNKLYPLKDFKSFGVLDDRGNHAIVLTPIKRFSPAVSVYFPDEVGETLVDILGTRLPMEDVKLDFIDIIVRKLRI